MSRGEPCTKCTWACILLSLFIVIFKQGVPITCCELDEWRYAKTIVNELFVPQTFTVELKHGIEKVDEISNSNSQTNTIGNTHSFGVQAGWAPQLIPSFNFGANYGFERKDEETVTTLRSESSKNSLAVTETTSAQAINVPPRTIVHIQQRVEKCDIQKKYFTSLIRLSETEIPSNDYKLCEEVSVAEQDIQLCKNPASAPSTCNYEQKVGVSFLGEKKAGFRIQQEDNFTFLKEIFLDLALTTKYNWSGAPPNVWQRLQSAGNTAVVVPRRFLHIRQIVGYCGDFVVYSNFIEHSEERLFEPLDQQQLMNAIKSGNLDIVKQLVESDKVDINVRRSSDSRTPLNEAVCNSKENIVNYLISKGVVINDGTSVALNCSAGKGYKRIFVGLVNAGANLNVKDSSGRPFLESLPENYKHVAESAHEYQTHNNATVDAFVSLIGAIEREQNHTVQKLLQYRRVDPNYQRMSDLMTPMIHAGCCGNLAAAELLVSYGSMINGIDGNRTTALMCAAKNGHLAVVDYLIKEGASIKQTDISGLTALHHAVINKHLAIVKTIIETDKSIINEQTRDGDTALILAARQSHMEIVSILLIASADVNFANGRGATALIEASNKGSKEITETLLYDNNALVNVQMTDGETALIVAARNGHLNVVKILVEIGKADTDIQNDAGMTALMVATFNNRLEIVRFLLNVGKAEVSTADNKGWTVMFYATAFGSVDIVKELMRYDENIDYTASLTGETLLMAAAKYGNVNVIKLLLNLNLINVDATDNEGWNAILLAAKYGHVELVKELAIKGKASLTGMRNGKNAVIYAAENGHRNVISLLSELGVTVNDASTSSNGWSPIHFAADAGQTEVAHFLLRKLKAVCDKKTNDGTSAIMLASEKGHLKTVRFLVGKCKADVMSLNNQGLSAVVLAAINGHADIVSTLLQNADPTAISRRYNNDWTALHYAAAHGQVNVAELLIINFSAPIDDKDNNGETPMMVAAANGHRGTVQFLVEIFRADVNAVNAKGETTLLKAVFSGNSEMVKTLISNCNADHQRTYRNGRTVIHYAAIQDSSIEVIQALVQNGGNVNDKDSDGNTPLMLAAISGHSIMKFLRFGTKGRANLKVQNKDGDTALILAARNGHDRIVSELLESGNDAGIEMRNSSGKTAFMAASLNSHLTTAKILLLSGKVNINVTDHEDRTVLMQCAASGNLKCVRFLIENQVDVSYFGKTGENAIYLAKLYGNTDTANELANYAAQSGHHHLFGYCNCKHHSESSCYFCKLFWKANCAHDNDGIFKCDTTKNLSKDCRVRNKQTSLNDVVNGALVFLDRHNLVCDDNTMLKSFSLKKTSNIREEGYAVVRRRTIQSFYFEYSCCGAQEGRGVDCSDMNTMFTEANGISILPSHNVQCGRNQLLGGFKVETRTGENVIRYSYKCCLYPVRSCESYFTNWDTFGNGNVDFLDRHDVACPNKKPYMSSFRLEHRRHGVQCEGAREHGCLRYNYDCCELW